MNSTALAALFTAMGAVVISVFSSMQASKAQKDKSVQDRLVMAQNETDKLIKHQQEENEKLWTRVSNLQTENDKLWTRIGELQLDNDRMRKKLRQAGID